MLAGGLCSCTSDIIKPKASVVPDSAKFSLNVIPIFTKSCAIPGCHNGTGHGPDLSAANAYNNLTLGGYYDTDHPELSILYVEITGDMSKYTTKQDSDTILKWIKQGALDN